MVLDTFPSLQKMVQLLLRQTDDSSSALETKDKYNFQTLLHVRGRRMFRKSVRYTLPPGSFQVMAHSRQVAQLTASVSQEGSTSPDGSDTTKPKYKYETCLLQIRKPIVDFIYGDTKLIQETIQKEWENELHDDMEPPPVFLLNTLTAKTNHSVAETEEDQQWVTFECKIIKDTYPKTKAMALQVALICWRHPTTKIHHFNFIDGVPLFDWPNYELLLQEGEQWEQNQIKKGSTSDTKMIKNDAPTALW